RPTRDHHVVRARRPRPPPAVRRRVPRRGGVRGPRARHARVPRRARRWPPRRARGRGPLMLEWTTPELPAQVTLDPTTFVDGHGQFNTAPAVLIHSGDGDGACVEGPVRDLVAWLDAARAALLEAFAADAALVSEG